MKNKPTLFVVFSLIFLSAASMLSAAAMREALSAFGTGKTGIERATYAIETLNKAVRNYVFEPRAKKFLKFVEESLDEFDFIQLYNSSYLRLRKSDNYKTVTLHAKNEAKRFYVSMVHSPYTTGDFSELGTNKSEWGLRKNDKPVIGDRSFEGMVRFKAGLAQFSHQEVTAYLENLLKMLDPASIAAMSAPDSLIYPNMKGDSRRLLNEFMADYPATGLFLNKYTRLYSLVSTAEHEGKKYTKFRMHGALKIDVLEKDYPDIVEWLEDIQDLFKIRLWVNDDKGNNILSLVVNPENYSIIFTVHTAGGQVLPTKGGKPVFDSAFSIAKVDQKKFFSVANFNANVYGLKFNTGNIIVYSNYINRNDSASFFAKITRLPDMSVSGRFYHVIPPWMIDIAIPGNIQELINKFKTVMEKANNGKGTRLTIGISKENGNYVALGQGDSEFLDNRFVRIGLKIWNRKFRPSQDSVDNILYFFENLSDKMLVDMKKM